MATPKKAAAPKFDLSAFTQAVTKLPSQSTSVAAPVAALSYKAPSLNSTQLITLPTSITPANSNEDNRGVISKAFDWLWSGGQAVENSIDDIINGVKKSDAPLKVTGKVLRDLSAGVVGYAQPVIDLGPIKTPWEKEVSHFTYNFKTKNNGGEEISGAKILKDLDFPDNTISKKIAKGVLGFAIDIATDPLTYTGVGALEKVFAKTPEMVEAANYALRGSKEEKTAAVNLLSQARDIGQKKATLYSQGVTPTQANKELKEDLDAFDQIAATLDPHNASVARQLIEDTAGLPIFKNDFMQGRDLYNLTRTTKKDFDTQVRKAMSDHESGLLSDEEWQTQLDALTYSRALRDGSLPFYEGFDPALVNKLSDWYLKEGTTSGRSVEDLTPRFKTSSPIEDATGEIRKATLQVKKGLSKEKILSPKDQAKLFDKVAHLSPDDGLSAFRTAQRELEAEGFRFADWNGNSLNLADVIEHLDPAVYSGKTTIQSLLKSFSTTDGHLAIKNIKFADKVKPEEQTATIKALTDAVDTTVAKNQAQYGILGGRMFQQILSKYPEMENLLTPYQLGQWLSQKAEQVKLEAGLVGTLTKKEQNSLKEIIAEYYPATEDIEPQELVDALGGLIAKHLATGLRSLEVSGKGYSKEALEAALLRWKVAKSLNKTFGLTGDKLLNAAKIANTVEQWWGLNLTTWWGRGFMKSMERTEVTLNRQWAAARSAQLSRILKEYTNDEIVSAWRLAVQPFSKMGDKRTVLEIAATQETNLSDREVKLGRFFEQYMEEMLGSNSKLQEDIARSVAARSIITPQNINTHLKEIGSKWQFKTGENWQDSWRNVDLASIDKDPVSFLYNLDLAIQRTLSEYNLIDSFVGYAGRKVGEAGFDPNVHTSRFVNFRVHPDVRFHPEAAKQFQRLLYDFHRGGWRPGSPMTAFLTTALRKWKTAVTIYYPSHHIRNLIGDTWNTWAAGYNDVSIFNRAGRVLQDAGRYYEDVIGDTMSRELHAILGTEDKASVATKPFRKIVNKYGAGITSAEMYELLHDNGLLIRAFQVEDLLDAGDSVGRKSRLFNPFGGKVHDTFAKVSEYREHYVRMAHAIGYLEKRGNVVALKKLAKETDPVARAELLKQAFSGGTEEIRKFHPDGTDLTKFEQQYMRNIMPFYSWSRKAIPLVLESMVLKPAKITAYPKATYAVQQAVGIQSPGPTDQFPQDQLFPDWMEATGIGPVGEAQSDNPFARWFGKLGQNSIGMGGQEQGYTIIDPSQGAFPIGLISDLLGKNASPGQIREGLYNDLTPFFTIPAELATGYKPTGQGIYNQEGGQPLSFANYLLTNTPYLSNVPKLTGATKHTQEGTENSRTEAILNAILGAGITGTGRYTKSAEFEEKRKN